MTRRARARRATWAAALAGALCAIAACADLDRGPRWRAAGAAMPREGGTLRFAAKDAVRTLDPAIAYDEASMYALHALVDGLVDYDGATTRLIPRLAERWDRSPDGLRYRFWLRAGLRYADGAPIVAADFVYALERTLGLADSPFATYLTDVAGADEVIAGKAARCAGLVASSERELEIRLRRPNAAFVYVLAMAFAAPLRPDHVAAAGAELRRRPQSSGPYQLVGWDEGQQLVFERNPHYHDRSRQRLERMVFHENVPRDTQFLMFERGELDTAERLAAPDHLWIVGQPAWRPYVHSQALMNSIGARMDVRQRPFDDRRVRQALNYALSKDHTVKLLSGRATPAHGVLAPGTFGRDDTLAPYPHDPARARALLAAAGYRDGLRLRFYTLADEDAEKVATSMRADFAEVGVALDISLMSFATFASTVGKSEHGLAFSYVGWGCDFPDPSGSLDPKFHSRAIAAENSTNDSFYANPELDRLLDRARVATEAAERAALYQRAERILYDDAPWIWNYHQLMTEVTQPYVQGFAPHPIWVRDYTSVWLDLGPDGEPLPP